MSKAFRRALPIALAIAATLSISQTALGFTPTKQTGTVGVYSVTDTNDSPGAVCQYKPTTPSGVTKLKGIDVNPPQMKAIAGAGNETVGWRFVLKRTTVHSGDSHVNRIYKSPIWKTTTDSAHDASFGQESVKVTIPYSYLNAPKFTAYSIVVKMYWYKPNGTTVRGMVSGPIHFYAINNGANPGPFEDACSDYDD